MSQPFSKISMQVNEQCIVVGICQLDACNPSLPNLHTLQTSSQPNSWDLKTSVHAQPSSSLSCKAFASLQKDVTMAWHT
eukprot:873272-Amphidinium_carterae.1